MKWFNKKSINVPQLPEIEEVSEYIVAISEYLDAFRLPEVFKQSGYDTLPVVNTRGEVVGIVSEYDLARVIPEWSLSIDSYMKNITVGDIMTKKVWTETRHTNIEKLLSRVPDMHTRVIPIVDEENKYTGTSITRTALMNYLTKLVKPRSLGGLATPLGVYMTDGIHQSGSKNLGLILTGITFAVFIYIIDYLTYYIEDLVPDSIVLFSSILIFLLLIRFTPLSKIHAAEHKTINAIERGFPLDIEAVKFQSRIHKRCGTNIMVLLFGILFIQAALSDIPFESMFPNFTEGSLWFIRFIMAFISFLFLLSYWKDIGGWIQKYLTTAEPSINQIKNGIDAGEELLKMHKSDTRNISPTFLSKIWNMGLIQIFFTIILTLFIFNLIKQFVL